VNNAYPLLYSHGQKRFGVKTRLRAQPYAGLCHMDEVFGSPLSFKQEQVGRFLAKLWLIRSPIPLPALLMCVKEPVWIQSPLPDALHCDVVHGAEQ